MSEVRRAPTLHDVARQAGVHPATVSRALSRPAMVAPATRTAVLEAVERIGFVPNRSARQLVRGRSDAVGVIVPDITNPYFGAILRSIQSAAGDTDLAVLIADTGTDPDEERRAVATLGRRVDGLVAVTPLTSMAAAPVPVVQVNRRSRGVPSVAVDQAAIVETAVDHLTALGHRHLAVLRGPAPYWSAARRNAAVQRLLQREDLHIDLLDPAPATFDGGRTAFDAVHRSGATAVVAFNDLQAAGVLVAAAEAGRSVPESLSIVGSDGLDLATMTSPPLSTVAAPLAELGLTALAKLNELLDAGGSSGDDTADIVEHRTLQPHLVVRATTAAPPHRTTRRTAGPTASPIQLEEHR